MLVRDITQINIQQPHDIHRAKQVVLSKSSTAQDFSLVSSSSDKSISDSLSQTLNLFRVEDAFGL